jgi:transposase InsO family protein
VLGREAADNSSAKKRARIGYAYLHTAIDAHSRLAYTEALGDERAPACAAFWRRAAQFFAAHGIEVGAVLTDNAWAYRYNQFNEALGPSVEHRFIRPRRPQTNGKVERFHRTLAEEWAYARPYSSEAQRLAALDEWLHLYNHHRHHTAVGGPPISRVNDPAGHYS